MANTVADEDLMTARSFDPDPAHVVALSDGRRVHRDHAAHEAVIAPRLETVRDGVWSLVGNGLSNQTFVRVPEGIVAIDTGESVEEMREALRRLREVDASPIVGVLYTHFHYVEGTAAILEEPGRADPLPVIGHEGIAGNRERATAEIGPAYARGLVEQFAIALPPDGPDASLHVGLGRFYRNPAHAPFTRGHLPVTHPLRGTGGTFRLGGALVEWAHAPSDADDSVNYRFADLELCVHNSVWPALFNVYAIRGEEYRDPRVLLAGIEGILRWDPAHLVGAHGPSISGRAEVRRRATRYRDSIQFLWDQTVRGINKGWTTGELASRVRLPALYDEDYLTSERYGVAEHHVRQIHAGLRGWFDGDEAALFPLAPDERHARLVEGFGGRGAVGGRAAAALAAGDLRWALELATWLARSPDATPEDRALLARCLRALAERTPAANIRSWAITRARHLDGSGPMDRHYVHRFGARALDGRGTAEIVATLRVTLDPDLVAGMDHHVAFVVGDVTCGLHVRHGVAVPTDGAGAASTVRMDRGTLVAVLSGRTPWSAAVAAGAIEVRGDAAALDRVRSAFEVEGLRG